MSADRLGATGLVGLVVTIAATPVEEAWPCWGRCRSGSSVRWHNRSRVITGAPLQRLIDDVDEVSRRAFSGVLLQKANP